MSVVKEAVLSGGNIIVVEDTRHWHGYLDSQCWLGGYLVSKFYHSSFCLSIYLSPISLSFYLSNIYLFYISLISI